MPLKQKSIIHYISAPAPRYMLRVSILNKLFKEYIHTQNTSFLEIGPGLGDISHYLIEHNCINKGYAIEASRDAAVTLEKRFKDYNNFKIYQGEFTQFNLKGIDLVCAFEVLEHIENDVLFLENIYNTLVGNGLFFISVPAYKKKWQRQDEWAGHIRRYEKQELRTKLTQSGFKVEKIIDYGFPLMTLLIPIKELYYKTTDNKSNAEKTSNSGIDRPIFGNKNSRMLNVVYAPFIFMQRLFYNSERGDGLIVVARKQCDRSR